MNNTKTIFKSLLIMIVAISLFTVSCSKDEGGTKTPTNPTPKDSATLLTDILRGLGALKGTGQEATVTMVDLSNIQPKSGEAAISGANKSYDKVKTALSEPLKKANFINDKIELTADATIPIKPTGAASLDVKLIFKAKAPYEFDTTITTGAAYIYSDSDKTATLTLKISPEGVKWE
ncbi:hypothetical protein [Brachyspira aalborgi]|uniref:Lipoprotein n=1 Tax=Brachyspira aalborgi TaxID=29522 RepID=A0A5C8CH18_9SPIR|nr:hypothetical protein [Brachyspira aalborgi]TXJ11691.1 hypothetical protein EPJ80_08235 [Brachyspira aalborgi]